MFLKELHEGLKAVRAKNSGIDGGEGTQLPRC